MGKENKEKMGVEVENEMRKSRRTQKENKDRKR